MMLIDDHDVLLSPTDKTDLRLHVLVVMIHHLASKAMLPAQVDSLLNLPK